MLVFFHIESQPLKNDTCTKQRWYLLLSFFSEGESFEAFCPARLDELLREAQRLEQHLKNQKERLRERLTVITRTLQKPVM